MKTPNPIAITAAILFTTVSLLALSPNTSKVHATEINGAKVIDLAPVEVRPSADDQRAAALLASANLTLIDSPISRGVERSASLLGEQLAMPYYSFGSAKFAGISKE